MPKVALYGVKRGYKQFIILFYLYDIFDVFIKIPKENF